MAQMRLPLTLPLLLLLVAVPAFSLKTDNANDDQAAGTVKSTGGHLQQQQQQERPVDAVLSRQRRNPLLIPVGVALVRAGARYVVRIGPKIARAFKSRKEAMSFLRQPETIRKINNLPANKGNVVSVPSKTVAKDLSKRLSDGRKSKPAYHGNPKRGDAHFHPVDKKGNLKAPHISHPKISPKTRTKYSSGAKAKEAKAAAKAQKAAAKASNKQAGKSKSYGGSSKVGKAGGSKGGANKGASRQGGSNGAAARGGSSRGTGSKKGGSRGGSSGGSRGGSSGGSRGGSSGGSRGGSSGGSRGGSSGGSRGGRRG